MRSRDRKSVFVQRESLILGVTRIGGITSLLLALASPAALAQTGTASEAKRPVEATRAALDSLATTLTASANAVGMPPEKRDSLRRFAAELRSRLRSGDFQPGDRIVVITHADSLRTDTLTVLGDRTIIFRQLPPISLDGLLRSELQSAVTQELQQYVKHEVVRVIPLVSVGVLGEVVRPGYYRVPLQISLGDLLMVAGGPSMQADMNRVEVRRGRTLLIDEHSVRDALVRRLPLGELGIDAGDEVILEAPHQHNWLLVTQLAGVVTGLVLTLHSLKVF